MSAADLDVLIINHLADLDDAAKRLTNVESRVFQAIDHMIEDAANEAGWEGKFDWWGNELWLAPKSWKAADDKWRGHFEFGFGAGDTGNGEANEDYFYLTRLCQMAVGKLGFKFKSEVLGSKLKTYTREAAPLLKSTPFSVNEDGWWFMPLHARAVDLAEAIAADDLSKGLEPISKQVQALIQSGPAFDRLLEKIAPPPAKNKKGGGR